MRSAAKWVIRICIAVFSIDAVIVVIDSFGRWEWLRSQILAYPSIASVVHGPTFPLFCLGICILVVYGERYLHLPDIKGVLLNSQSIPNLSTATMKDVFDTQAKKPGWDKKEIGWYWLIQVRLTNHSDTPVTVEEIKATVKVGGNKWLRKMFPFVRRTIQMKHLQDISTFRTYPQNNHLTSLFGSIKGVPLTRGIGYSGWIGFSGRATQGEMQDKPSLDVWFLDALDVEHILTYRGDEKSWDTSFQIMHD